LKEQYSKKAKQTTIKNMVKINLHTGKVKKNHCKHTMMCTSFITYQLFVTHKTVATPQHINGNSLELNMKSQSCLQHELL